jgi:predicted metal-dependent peptidase
MFVKKGNYVLIADLEDGNSSSSKSPDNKNTGDDGSIQKETPDDVKMPKVGEETPGMGKTSDLAGKGITNKAQEIKKPAGKSQIYKGPDKKVKTDWKKLSQEAISRSSSLSDTAKRILRELQDTKGTIDWKKELKKFFDRSLSAFKEVMPKRRFASTGLYLRGVKRSGEETFKTVVAAIDTSYSISQEQSKTFVTEVMNLCKTFKADVTYIIYCSDDIGIRGKGGIDIVKKGEQPDFTKWCTTGGNSKGFIPPFEWLEKNKIVPSVMVYLSDTQAEMPSPNKYGIRKYMDKVVWFVCGSRIYNQPPFGKIYWVPKNAIK